MDYQQVVIIYHLFVTSFTKILLLFSRDALMYAVLHLGSSLQSNFTGTQQTIPGQRQKSRDYFFLLP